ncbi:hypothetical protein FRB91_008730 [Serendipita sp. 411]|nr:hypothetical protein FRB91_008730 [Serendipita sp. 411]
MSSDTVPGEHRPFKVVYFALACSSLKNSVVQLLEHLTNVEAKGTHSSLKISLLNIKGAAQEIIQTVSTCSSRTGTLDMESLQRSGTAIDELLSFIEHLQEMEERVKQMKTGLDAPDDALMVTFPALERETKDMLLSFQDRVRKLNQILADNHDQSLHNALSEAWDRSPFSFPSDCIRETSWMKIVQIDGSESYRIAMGQRGESWVRDQLSPDSSSGTPLPPTDCNEVIHPSSIQTGPYTAVYGDLKAATTNLFSRLQNSNSVGHHGAKITSEETNGWSTFLNNRIPSMVKSLGNPKTLRVGVLGVLSHGKSSFLNCILPDPLLPSGNLATTAWPVVIRHDASRTEPVLRITPGNLTPYLEGLRSSWRRASEGNDAKKTVYPSRKRKLSPPEMAAFDKFIPVEEDPTQEPFSFPEEDVSGLEAITACLNDINHLVRICWKVLEEDDLPRPQSYSWPELHIKLDGFDDNLGKTCGEPGLTLEFIDLPGIGEVGKDNTPIPDWIMTMALKDIGGTILIARANEWQNEMVMRAVDLSRGHSGRDCLAVYGTNADFVSSPEDTIDGLYSKAYGEFDGVLDKSRIALCSPGPVASSRYVLKKTMPYWEKEKVKRQEAAKQGKLFWEWDGHVLEKKSSPPNMPPFEIFEDAFSETALSKILMVPSKGLSRYQQKYFKDGGLEAWVKELRLLHEDEHYEFSQTRNHILRKVIVDGCYRLHFCELENAKSTLEQVINQQLIVIDSARKKVETNLNKSIHYAMDILSSWKEEETTLIKDIRKDIDKHLKSLELTAKSLVVKAVEKIARDEEHSDWLRHRAQSSKTEIWLTDTEAVVSLIAAINQVLKEDLRKEQASLNIIISNKSTNAWKLRLKSLKTRLTEISTEEDKVVNQVIANALDKKSNELHRSVYELIVQKLDESQHNEEEASLHTKLNNALSKPWLAHQDATSRAIHASKSGPSVATSTQAKSSIITRALTNLITPVLSATTSLSTRTDWGFLDKRIPGYIPLRDIISVHQKVVASAWLEVLREHMSTKLDGTIQIATETGQNTVLQLFALRESAALSQKNDETLEQRILEDAVSSATLSALSCICTVSEQRMGPEIVSRREDISDGSGCGQ